MATGPSRPEFGERAEHGPGDVCYRHPGVASFTLCQRCGRTICPDCQTASPVGLLCPDCVRQARPAATQRAARSARATGRRLSDAQTPVVTYGLMIACALVFAAQLIGSRFGSNDVTAALWYVPLYSLPPGTLAGLGFEPWRMITVMFTHSTSFLPHILFNMLTLWLFGRNLETMIGRVRFALLYLFSGVGGALAVMLWVYADFATIQVATVGASGAIFGVMGATLVAYRAARVNVTSLAVLIIVNLGIGFMPGAAISWQSHLGGLVVGALTMWIMLATRGPRKRALRVAALCGLAVVLVALSFAYFVAVPLPAGY